MNNNKLTWSNGWSVNPDLIKDNRLKRLRQLDINLIIKSRKIPIKLITVLNRIDN